MSNPNPLLNIILLILEIGLTIYIAVYSYRGYKSIGDKRLLNIYLGFTLVGGGLLTELLTTIFTRIFRFIFFGLVGDYTSISAQLIGYLIIVSGYYRYREGYSQAVPPAIIFTPLSILYIANSIATIFILYKILVNYILTRDRAILYSLSAFTVLTFSYALLGIAVLRPTLNLMGNVIRLLGFTILAFSIARPVKEGVYE